MELKQQEKLKKGRSIYSWGVYERWGNDENPIKNKIIIHSSFQKNQLCQSVGEDDVKNTLLKFGKVLHLFQDISMFKKNMKTLSGTSKKSKEKVKPVKENKSNSKADKEV